MRDLALPNHQRPEPELLQPMQSTEVTRAVVSKLRGPEIPVPLRHGCFRTTFMCVPVTTMDEDSPPLAPVRQVRRTGQVTVGCAVSNSRLVENTTHDQLRGRRTLADAAEAP